MPSTAPPAVPSPAATLVLMRDRGGSGPPEVLLVERHADSHVGAGLYVFPGGMVDAADESPQAAALSPGLGAAEAARRLGSANSPQAALGYWVAAIRETFEEAGVLLARSGDRPLAESGALAGALDAARAAVNDGRAAFLEMLAAQGWVLDTAALVYFAHWVTPETVPRRFDTRFFLARAPQGSAAGHDTREVVSHIWLTPAEALASAAGGRTPMIEPTVKNLERLAVYESTEAALRCLRGQAVPRIMPKMITDSQGRRRIVLPWDPTYETV